MPFKDLNLKLIYDNSTMEITENLIIPLLTETKLYHRGVGFFSSNWIRLVTKGLNSLAKRGGRIELITSPKLSEEDWEAIKLGEKATVNKVLYESIKRTIDSEFDVKTKHDSLNLFSWLIADGIINLRFAVCKNKKGMYHDKLAIFEDESGDRVCLHGSFNDSLQATYNGESFSVFKSWEPGQAEYVTEHLKRFKNMWEQNNEFYHLYEVPEMLKVELRKYQSEKRPYEIKKKEIQLPNFIKDLNDYQKNAIEGLINNDWKGILEMATGTGKTITSIAASMKYYEKRDRIFLIVVVPFNHLIEQWESNILSFGYKVPVKCCESKGLWYNRLKSKIKDFNSGLTKIECAIVSYKTFGSSDFLDLVSKIKQDVFFIADECHYAGSGSIKGHLPQNFDVRVGLSATPDRWFDEEGTGYIRNYFKETVFEYGMEEAIENGYLCKYEYEPVVVSLNSEEYREYRELTNKITKILMSTKEVEKDSPLERLILKRADIISKAESKLPILIEMLKEQKAREGIKHTLVYCSKGESKKITKVISDLGIKVHEFVAEVSNSDRTKILKLFDAGEIDVLVAIKCLDEGVDVPSTKTAYFLSSTSNPREFIQRRGRILRNFPGKNMARIIDFIVLPNRNSIELLDERIDTNIIEKEMPRFAEFSRFAFNEFSARSIVRSHLSPYNLEYLMDKLPWEVYKERKERYDYE